MAKTRVVNHNRTMPTFNGNGSRRFVINEESLSRLALMSLGGMLPPLNIEQECRYPEQITLQDYQKFYDREGIATRVVDIYPDEAWQMPPEVYEVEALNKTTDFEEQWNEMKDTLSIFTHLQTANELSGIGNYGVVLLGFDDGRPLSDPVAGFKSDGTPDGRFRERKLLYLRPMSQCFASIKTFESKTSSPRYGQPNSYTMKLMDLMNETSRVFSLSDGTISNLPGTAKDMDVHWTRVLHISRKNTGSDVFHTPELENVYNRIWDIKKILGSNGQGFWNTGFPGLSMETQPNIEDPEIDVESVKEEIKNFMLGLQRYIATDGMHANPINFVIPEPGPHWRSHMEYICATKAVPLRVFMGSEEAKLASGQDMRTWNKRLGRYQSKHITPFIIRNFFERMFMVGALPRPKQLVIEWPDLNEPTGNDRANTAHKLTDALVKYISGNVFLIMPPKEFLVNVMGFPLVKVEAFLKAAGVDKMMKKLMKLAEVAMTPKQPAAAFGSKNPAKRTKKPAPRED